MTFEFGLPWAFALLPLPLLIYFIVKPLRKKRSALIIPSYFRWQEASGERPLSSAWISRRNILQWVLLSLVWMTVVAAASSPQLVGEPELKKKTARSFLIATDLSFSMATKDWSVDGQLLSRWDAVKLGMKDFLKRREGDKIGLIFFGTNPYLQAPLTTELDVIQWMIDETDIGMAGQTTGIGAAVGMGIDVLKRDTLKSKVLLLLTDGVDSGSDISPVDAAQLAKNDSVKIYTLGIGDPEKPGADLDEATLKTIAATTGGEYFRAIDPEALESVYQTLEGLEPIEYEEEEYKPTILLYAYPLGTAITLAFILQSITSLINYRRRVE